LRFFSSHVGVAVVNLLDEPRCHELVAVAEEGSLGRATRIEPLPGGHAVFEHLQGALVPRDPLAPLFVLAAPEGVYPSAVGMPISPPLLRAACPRQNTEKY
jgi:hypothetical protein